MKLFDITFYWEPTEKHFNSNWVRARLLGEKNETTSIIFNCANTQLIISKPKISYISNAAQYTGPLFLETFFSFVKFWNIEFFQHLVDRVLRILAENIQILWMKNKNLITLQIQRKIFQLNATKAKHFHIVTFLYHPVNQFLGIRAKNILSSWRKNKNIITLHFWRKMLLINATKSQQHKCTKQ